MKIAFICGCLEEGQDGVGDYTRLLAESVLKLGHQVLIISLNDKRITSLFEPKIFRIGELGILRIPSNTTWTERTVILKDWIETFNPDWVSLQYVPFSFQDKGLPIKLGNYLKTLGHNFKWHIMFHELWVGMPKTASLKHVFWGCMQRWMIIRLVSKLQPSMIHTQCQLYLAQLKKLGFEPQLLPLFSNIPVVNNDEICFERKVTMSNFISLIAFGTIHEKSSIDQFAKEAASLKSERKINIILTVIGRNGKGLKKFLDIWENAGLESIVLGEQKTEDISKALADSDFGVATGTPIMIEKNGTVAAMREHGLPVICVGENWTARGVKSVKIPCHLLIFRPGNLDKLFSQKFDRSTTFNQIEDTSRLFIDSLRKSEFYNNHQL